MFKVQKESIKKIFRSRMHVLILFFCAAFLGLAGRLFTLQIVKGQYYEDNYKLRIFKTSRIPGTRGNIYDRNGEVLAYNEVAYSVTFEDDITGADRNEVLNGILEEVIRIVESHKDKIDMDFGIILDPSGEYAFRQKNETLRLRFIADVYGKSFIEDLSKEQENVSAADLIRYLCADESYGYGIHIGPGADKEQVLKLTALRYAINLHSFEKYIPATLARRVSAETAAEIMENADTLSGVDIKEDSVRRYVDARYFASVIGYTGQISKEEYDAMESSEKKKYAFTDVVGKAGIEKTMESVLRGTPGEKQYYVDSFGKVTDTLKSVEPKAGCDLYLTLDKNLQEDAYDLLEEKLAGILLDRMRNVMNYDPSVEENTADIIIPADDAYNAFIANSIIDPEHFKAPDALEAERQVYETFFAKKEETVAKMLEELRDPDAQPFYSLSPEMKAYMAYLSDEVLDEKTGVLSAANVKKEDAVYQNWRSDETISLHTYLKRAISQNWIDVSKLSGYLPQSKYFDSQEIFDAILKFLERYMDSDSAFDRLLYKYLIKSGSISEGEIAAIVYEQGVLPMEEDTYQALLEGAADPFSWLCEKIRTLEITPGQLALEPCTGSAVVSDPDSGEVLACVSYPGYDNNRMANTIDSDYFTKLVSGTARPFYNNATQERTAPGSTFKMVTTVAGLTEHVISDSTIINCSGIFTKVKPNPKCWIYPNGHGDLEVVGALKNSCNCFFYEVGYDLGISADGSFHDEVGVQKLQKYAKELGLGEKSGLEIPESEPHISDEYAVLSAIGQGTHNYTVSQLCRYVSVVANKGKVYKLTLLKKTTDSDGRIIKNYEPVIRRFLTDVSDYTWELIRQGMAAVVESSSTFQNLGIPMAGKTGTAQQSTLHPDHGLFLGFAPLDDPQIALAVRIANGYTSTYASEVGRDIVRSYFHLGKKGSIIRGEAARLGTVITRD